ncbi:MAG TPA: glucose-1-phosphate thymidylyltransferase [Thermoanaerobaculia bacterium]|nr:glucose-1-phosphate thymidylyltransferase [Thermoanaerobaculia bacterium]HSP93762.1 glucose-1-phosphate thymidylyltransferase [Thermoanaerobaculia bacterium]
MKGLILSGGKGTRLRPLTYTRAKQLVPVANKPVLFYGVEAIVAAGIREIGVVVGDTRDEIQSALGDGSRFGARITYIDQDAPRGLAHAVLISEPYLRGEPFVMYLGDNLIADGITALVDDYRRIGCNSQILLARVPNPEQFGVAELANGTVVRLTEKPKEPKSDLALVGVYMFDDTIFQAAREIRPSARQELEITDAIQWLVDHGKSVHPHVVSGWWKDTGKIEDMLEANRIILDTFTAKGLENVDSGCRVEGKVVVEPGARLVNATVRGPAIIGPGAEIRDAFVGPYTAIGPDCFIERCEIENSIVLQGSRLERIPVRIADSLIGTNVRIHPGVERPRVHRFLIGDNSEIGIV